MLKENLINSKNDSVWKILTIDDVSSVNEMTRRLLKDLSFMNKKLLVLQSSSLENAKEIFQKNPDIAVIMLDIAEKQESGLEFIRFIRKEIKNQKVRIILRTGYPDCLPDKKVVQNYSIDGYITKEITSKLQMEVTIITAIRSYNQIITTTKFLQSLAGSIAHEVRNPMGATNLSLSQIKNHINNIQKQDSSNSISDEISMMNQEIDTAANSIKRTNKLISVILDNIKEEEFDVKDFVYLSINNIIQIAIDEYGYSDAKEKQLIHLNIKPKQDFIFKGDEDIFIYLIFNLLKNSFYYQNTKPNFNITITIKQTPDHNQIIFRDNGIGISADKLKTIFESFFTFGKKGGTGLGLPFCKRVMKSFNGDIICKSEIGKWIEFILSFPKLSIEELKLAKEQLSKSSTSDIDSKPISILFVDDQKTNLFVTKSLLENNFPNLTCDIASNSAKAILMIKEKSYDLILVDLYMPVTDGFKTTKIIREFNPDIPVIAYSSLSSDYIKERIAEFKLNDYLIKPTPHDLLFKTIAKWTLTKYDINQQLSTKNLKEILKDKKILFAEDQDVNRMLTVKYLKNYDIIADQAKGGKEMIDKFIIEAKKGKPYDLILTDINMPDLSGDEAVKQVKEYQSQNNLFNIPVIAIMGDSEREEIFKILAVGFDDYFIKGDNISNLIKTIAFWIAIADEKKNSYQYFIESESNIKSLAEIPNYQILSQKIPQDMLSELVPLFIKESEILINQIKKAKKQKDIKQLRFAIRALKGTCSNIGAERLYQFCIYINNIISKENKWPKEKSWVGQLEKLFMEIKLLIRRGS